MSIGIATGRSIGSARGGPCPPVPPNPWTLLTYADLGTPINATLVPPLSPGTGTHVDPGPDATLQLSASVNTNNPWYWNVSHVLNLAPADWDVGASPDPGFRMDLEILAQWECTAGGVNAGNLGVFALSLGSPFTSAGGVRAAWGWNSTGGATNNVFAPQFNANVYTIPRAPQLILGDGEFRRLVPNVAGTLDPRTASPPWASAPAQVRANLLIARSFTAASYGQAASSWGQSSAGIHSAVRNSSANPATYSGLYTNPGLYFGAQAGVANIFGTPIARTFVTRVWYRFRRVVATDPLPPLPPTVETW